MTHSEERVDRKKLSDQNKEAQRKIKDKLGYSNEENNPCYKEQLLSMKCINDSNPKEKVCIEYFDNYKACKNFWSEIERQRRFKGIHPNLPPLEERAKIKSDYLNGKLHQF